MQCKNYLIIFFFSLLFSAPSFALDTLVDQNGKELSLEQLRGKYVVLEWLNFQCHMLKGHYEAMHIQRAQKKLRSKGIIWVSVLSQGKGQASYYENKDELNSALQFHAWDGDFAVRDSAGLWGRHFEAKKTPFHIVLNPEGKIIYKGALDDSNPFSHSEISLLKARNFLLMAVNDQKKGRKVKIPFSQSYGCPIRYSEMITKNN